MPQLRFQVVPLIPHGGQQKLREDLDKADFRLTAGPAQDCLAVCAIDSREQMPMIVVMTIMIAISEILQLRVIR